MIGRGGDGGGDGGGERGFRGVTRGEEVNICTGWKAREGGTKRRVTAWLEMHLDRRNRTRTTTCGTDR